MLTCCQDTHTTPLVVTRRLTKSSPLRSGLVAGLCAGTPVGAPARNRCAGGAHLQRLVRPVGVLVVDPLIEGLLGPLQVGERWSVAEEFGAQAGMEPLDHSRGGRAARLGQQMLDAVLAADRLNSTSVGG
jgi:hypothetical protein